MVQETVAHAAAIEALLDEAFGVERWRKTSYRLRDGVPPCSALCWVALDGTDRVVATLRFWPVIVPGVERVLLLGPIAVAKGHRQAGLGRRLITQGLTQAKADGWQAVILVGDEPYYGRFGFLASRAATLSLPGPVEANRLLALDLFPSALDKASGTVMPFRSAVGGLPQPLSHSQAVAR